MIITKTTTTIITIMKIKKEEEKEKKKTVWFELGALGSPVINVTTALAKLADVCLSPAGSGNQLMTVWHFIAQSFIITLPSSQ